MPLPSIQHCITNFENSVHRALSFQSQVANFRVELHNHLYFIGRHRVELFAGLALLRIHLAWEDFVESVFLRYMCGAISPSGYRPTLLNAPSQNISSAMATLLAPGGHSFFELESI